MSFIGFLGGQKFLNTILMIIGKEEDSVPFGSFSQWGPNYRTAEDDRARRRGTSLEASLSTGQEKKLKNRNKKWAEYWKGEAR